MKLWTNTIQDKALFFTKNLTFDQTFKEIHAVFNIEKHVSDPVLLSIKPVSVLTSSPGKQSSNITRQKQLYWQSINHLSSHRQVLSGDNNYPTGNLSSTKWKYPDLRTR